MAELYSEVFFPEIGMGIELNNEQTISVCFMQHLDDRQRDEMFAAENYHLRARPSQLSICFPDKIERGARVSMRQLDVTGIVDTNVRNITVEVG